MSAGNNRGHLFEDCQQVMQHLNSETNEAVNNYQGGTGMFQQTYD